VRWASFRSCSCSLQATAKNRTRRSTATFSERCAARPLAPPN
jgi:hypothetical protein